MSFANQLQQRSLSAGDVMLPHQHVQFEAIILKDPAAVFPVEFGPYAIMWTNWKKICKFHTSNRQVTQDSQTLADFLWFKMLLIRVGFGFKSVAAVLCPPPAFVCSPTCSAVFFLFFPNSHTSTHPHMANRTDCHQNTVMGLNLTPKQAHTVA